MTAPKITHSTSITDDKTFYLWDQLLDGLTSYSFFQTPAWSQLLQKANPQWRPSHHFIQFDDGVECIVMGFTEVKPFGFQKYEALPWGTYGNPIGNGIQAHHIAAIAIHFLSFRQPVMNIILHPAFYGTIETNQSKANRIDEYSTHILHLNQPFEDIEKQRFQSRLRTSIRKAEQEGISVRWSNSKETVDAYKHLYQEACERWGGDLAVPLHFFDYLIDQDGKDIRIWLAEYHGEIIAADVMLYGRNEVQYFTGAMNAEYIKRNASKLLMSKVIEDACSRNYGLINFGSSAGLEGVEQFKERFGGIKTYYARLVYRHFAFRFIP